MNNNASKTGFAKFLFGKILTSILELVYLLASVAVLFTALCLPLSVVGYWTLELAFGIGFVSESMVQTYYCNGFIGMIMVLPVGIFFALKEEYDKVKRLYLWRVENDLEKEK